MTICGTSGGNAVSATPQVWPVSAFDYFLQQKLELMRIYMDKLIKIAQSEAILTINMKTFYLVMATILLPSLIALTVGFAGPLTQHWHWPFSVPFSVLIILQVIASYFAYSGVHSAQEAYFQVVDIEKERDVLRDQLWRAEKIIDQQNVSNGLARAWHEILLSARRNKIANYTEFNNLLDMMLRPMCFNVGRLFQCDSDELWNVAVYCYDQEARELLPVWRRHHDLHPAETLGRPWRPGEGHIGKAFADRSAKITQDAADADVAALMEPPEMSRRPYDGVYRSYASIPIINDVAPEDDPLGVIVITSNRPARFNKANSVIFVWAASFIAEAIHLTHNGINGVFPPSAAAGDREEK